jgi:4-hydroxy-2-oxoheptanedioate aldolase
MKLPKNRFKSGLKKSGAPLLGVWSNLKSPMVAELLSGTGFDWAVLDMEHGPNDLGDIVSQLQVMEAGSVPVIVRPPWNDFVLIKRLLDSGVTSLLIPYVQNAEEAREAVAATRYPPDGIRGVAGGSRATRFGMVADYHQNAHKEICITVQVETASAVDEIEAIAAVKGVDALFVGPADLAASMGHLGDFNHADVQTMIRTAAKRIKAAGKPAGILSFSPDQAREYIAMGYDFVAIASDQSLLVSAAKTLLAKFDDVRKPSS